MINTNELPNYNHKGADDKYKRTTKLESQGS